MQQVWEPERRQTDDGEVIDFGDGVVVPVVIERVVADKSLPYDLALTLTFQDGRYELAGVAFRQRPGGEPVSGQYLRRVAVDRLVRQVMSEWLPRRRPRPKSGRRLVRPGEVASIYRLAYALHLPPTATVADRLGISQGAAEQAVIVARAAGRLPETQQGKAKA
jgi:hypothetical protein